jgi:hypothetical protein
MSGFFFALLAVLIAGFAARDQLLLADFSARQGARPALLVVALASALATMALAAWAGQLLAPRMNGNARTVFAALALGIAAVEMLFARRRKSAVEPTRSLGAFAIVLFAQQLTDAARFAVFAIAVATHAPIAAGLGGATAAVAMIGIGWTAGAALAERNVLVLRRALGGALLVVAIAIGMVGSGRF